MNSDIISTFSESTSLSLQLNCSILNITARKTEKSHLDLQMLKLGPIRKVTYRARREGDEKKEERIKIMMFVHCLKKREKEKKN